jgi:hypothetical protein
MNSFGLFTGKRKSLTLVSLALVVSLVFTGLGNLEAHGEQSDLRITAALAGVQSFAGSGLTGTVAVEDFTTRSSLPFTSQGVGEFSGSGTFGTANQYGGAAGSGKFMTAANVTLTLATTSDYRYIGFWWSAGNDPNDVILLSDDDTVLARFKVDLDDSDDDLINLVGDCEETPGVTEYCGNPNYNPKQVTDEPYAFVHLRYQDASGNGFRKVKFEGRGFELDNVTVSQAWVNEDVSVENDVVNFERYALSTPTVLIADPRTSSVSFPGIDLDDGVDETEAVLCFSEVTQAGGSISGGSSITAAGSASGIEVSSDQDNLVTFSGLRDVVENFAPSISFESLPMGERFGVRSLYLRVSVTPQAADSACEIEENVDSEIVNIRFLNIFRKDSAAISLD